MNEPTPEAIEAVAASLTGPSGSCSECRRPIATDDDYDRFEEGDGGHLCWSPWEAGDCTAPLPDAVRVREEAAAALVLIRDALHRDGDDSDAIRAALGLGGHSERTANDGVHLERWKYATAWQKCGPWKEHA